MTDLRKELRSRLRAERRALPAADRIAAADGLARQLLALPFAPRSGFVAGYWAMDGEIALHRWQLSLSDAVQYCLPVLDGNVLRFAPWKPGQPLRQNRYGIPEPDAAQDALLDADRMALVVAPLVGFDDRGGRLGMGGGWYDRTFAFRARSAAPPWLVGAAFAAQQVDAVPLAPWDVAVDAICTESATLPADRVTE